MLAICSFLFLSSRSPSQQTDVKSKQNGRWGIRCCDTLITALKHDFINISELIELELNWPNLWLTVVQDLRVRAGVLEDLQHTGAGDLPDLRAELLPVQDHQVFQTVCPRPSQLLVVCRGKVTTSKTHLPHTSTVNFTEVHEDACQGLNALLLCWLWQ